MNQLSIFQCSVFQAGNVVPLLSRFSPCVKPKRQNIEWIWETMYVFSMFNEHLD